MTTPTGVTNEAFVDDDNKNGTSPALEDGNKPNVPKEREVWGKDIEFLLSCIAMSVGLGNVWRFPFTALDNGGGAFLIPYIIVLLLLGRPVYYLEMLIGQFSSRGPVKIYDFCPASRGIGWGQLFATSVVSTYYAATMALTLRYVVASFSSELPWSYCRPEWGEGCIPSGSNGSLVVHKNGSSSAELYFTKIILREKSDINDGIGYPNWDLLLCLAASWLVITLIIIKGIRSSGKASYFLAIFPYIVMFVLLVRALTLPGAFNGVLYFIKPQWDKLLEAKVWYAAVTQVFFSLAIFFGSIIMYSSFNRFNHNIYRDCTIITSLDTFTSLLSGVIIFGILGNLAYERGSDDVQSVVRGGSGLAFISYPDAIAKFTVVPQLFSCLFFLMLFVLGIGSIVGMSGAVTSVLEEQFPRWKRTWVVCGTSLVCFLLGMVYITPGGQFLLNLVDFYGASFVAFFLAIAELITIGWVYGCNKFCKDVEFMLGIKTGPIWRICWTVVTPIFMIAILAYTVATMKPMTYNDVEYPMTAIGIGWCLFAFGLLQFPVWAIYAIYKQPKSLTIRQRIKLAFSPKVDWGPRNATVCDEYKKYLDLEFESDKFVDHHNYWTKIRNKVFG